MHVNYCTLFDINYIDKGLVMCRSLLEHAEDFDLYIFAFDDQTYKILYNEKLKNTHVLREEDLLDDQLRMVKAGRTRAEWCWTCSSIVLDYLMKEYLLDNCVYVDSDLLFFSDPEVLVQEMYDAEKSVLITEHRFFPCIENWIIANIYGKYCVQFNAFRGDEEGRKVLAWWKEQCIRDCSVNGVYQVYGDQKYQDEFRKKFSGVHVLQNEGGGIAPWNLSLYELTDNVDGVVIRNRKYGKNFYLCFFHFQGLKVISEEMIDLAVYTWEGKERDKRLVNVIYRSYLERLFEVRKYLKEEYALIFDNQVKVVQEGKQGKRKDVSFRRRMGQIMIGLMSYFRVRRMIAKDRIESIDDI